MKVLFVFQDDSSLYLALAVEADLAKRGIDADFLLVEPNPGVPTKLSDCQLSFADHSNRLLFRLPKYRAFDEGILRRYDAIVSAKFPVAFRRRAIEQSWWFRSRPCFIALFPGMEFFPEQGFNNRGMFDVIAFNNAADLELYEQVSPVVAPSHQQQVLYNPLFARNAKVEQDRSNIVFFPQSITPLSRQGRIQVAEMLARIREDNPAYRVIVKLRHREGENKNHTHIEKYAYQEIFRELDLVSRVEFEIGSTDDFLTNCAFAITCSSTAGMQAIARGIPTAFLTNFEGAQHDEIAMQAAEKLQGSGLLVDIADAHRLDFSVGEEAWRARNLIGEHGADDLLAAITRFHASPPKDVGIRAMVRGVDLKVRERLRFLKGARSK